ncbi:MAG: Hint domain-containing protein [Pseudomonadota bacterium]
MTDPTPAISDPEVSVYPGEALRAVAGANQGDGLGPADELCPGDVYRLSADAAPAALRVAPAGAGGAQSGNGAGAAVLVPGQAAIVAESSEAGEAGDVLRLTARITLLAGDGHSVDLVVIETDAGEVMGLPLGPLQPSTEYTLVGQGAPDPVRLADVAVFGFATGTRITMADGAQRSVEGLAAGQTVLTRDSGPQPLRAVLRRTERALGPLAPVVVSAGTMGNPGDLVVSQNQRLLVYQRGADRLTETAEMLVRAGWLVDGDQVFLREGGFTDYVTLVLDRHEMVYAECVAVESLEVSPATLARLPEAHVGAVGGLEHAPHWGTEAGRDVARAARARLLRRTEG